MSVSKAQSVGGYSIASPASDGARSRAAIEAQVLSLFDECAPALRRYVASFSLGTPVTEDIVQEVFLALFRHLSLGRPATNLKGWIFQVAHNLALKHRRKESRNPAQAVRDWGAAERVSDPASNPEETLAVRQRRRRLGAVLSRLPERDQRCVYLRAEGLCYRDIGRTLGISLGAVAKSLVRAFSTLANADKE
jgi:RNA polymerase sigma-70 factor (ECF subfamily)